MKQRIFAGFVFLAATLLTGVSADAAEEPQLDCQPHIAVLYSPGPNWSQRELYFEGHLAFVGSQFTVGALLLGGPFKEGDVPVGGLMIYASNKSDEVEKLVKQDPLVANHVAVYALKNWTSCKLAQAQHRD